MTQVAIVVVLGLVAAALAWWLKEHGRPHPERGPSYEAPVLVDRGDFVRPDAPWLVAVFSSSTCLACQGTWEKVQVLESDVVAVQEVESTEDRDLHETYGIEAVPMVLVIDGAGSVRRQFVGPPTATDLWSAVAELREPGSVPEDGCQGEGCGDH